MSIEKQLEIMEKWVIDANQLLLIELLFLSQQEGGALLLYKYFGIKEGTVALPISDVINLVEKGVLKEFDERDELYYDTLEITSKFQKEYFKEIDQIGQELWDNFPKERSYRIDPKQPLFTKKLDASFPTIEDFFRYYGRTIRYSAKKHAEIMQAVETAKSQGLVDFTIAEFVRSRMWETVASESKSREEEVI